MIYLGMHSVNRIVVKIGYLVSSVQSLSCVRLFVTPWTAAHQASLSITNSRSLPKLMSIDSECHPTISSSVFPSSSLQSFPTSRSFQISLLFASGSQSIGVSASTWVLPVNTQDWFPLGWTGWISLQFKGRFAFLRSSSSYVNRKKMKSGALPFNSQHRLFSYVGWLYIANVPRTVLV